MQSMLNGSEAPPTTAIVTGCAGFIGSHLAERLIGEGFRVIGIDAFRPFYDRVDKIENLARLVDEPRFDLVEVDLAEADLTPLFAKADSVFHLAAQAGVRDSFGSGFSQYAHDNVVATQRVFEAARDGRCRRVVWASSSSVYGNAATYPCVVGETPTAPRSPYGVTKRACEDLAFVYRESGLSLVGLRYFTVYGPRQRPDMAIRRLCEAAVSGATFPLFGDGSQTRDITFVGDVVSATVLAGRADQPAPLYNVGGGHEVSLSSVIEMIEVLSGETIALDRHEVQAGDVRRTGAETSRTRADLGWSPAVELVDGLRSTLSWVRDRHPDIEVGDFLDRSDRSALVSALISEPA